MWTFGTKLGAFGNILGASNLINGLTSGQLGRDSMTRVLEKLDQLQRGVDEISNNVEIALNNQKKLEIIATFSDDVKRLKWFMHYFEREIEYNEETRKFTPAKKSQEWAEAALTLSDDGLDHILYNIHDMIMGGNLLTSDSLFVAYERSMDRASSSYFQEYHNFANYTLTLESNGYALWIFAHMINNENTEIVENLRNSRLAAQHEYLAEIAPIWPARGFGLAKPATGCPYNHGVTFQEGWRYG